MNDAMFTRFEGCSDIGRIRDVVTVRPNLIRELGDSDALVSAEVLADTLKQIYLPNQFSLEFIKEMIDKASLYCRKMFESEAAYLSRVYCPPEVEVAPFCLTGLAGIGKSQTIAALRKVLPKPVDFTADHFEGVHQLVSYWYASARGKAGGRQLLLDFLHDDVGKTRSNVAKLLVECRRRANRDGVSLLMLEETQHINTGQGVSRVTDILLTMAAIGPPMVYVSNYSLVHKLLGRNSEDKQRLLAEPRIMLPDAPDSEAWRDYMSECVRVCNGHLDVNFDDFVEEMYRSTFGIKRLAVQLIKLAYIEARASGRKSISLADVHRAYLSVAYSANRGDLEELHRQALQNRNTGSRLDLRCPFDLPISLKSNVVQFVRSDRDNRVIDKIFHASLNEGERSAIEEIESSVPGATAKPSKPAKRPRIPKATDDELISAFHQVLESMGPPPKPKRPK
ncbi:transposase [Pseudomonas fluorescens]|uniref:transposase n=1 Tax=Pseudomonas fluorescens TaxID=294 RepID=UPI0012417C5C|nr:transposase [Pseudomonas fluorescens]CAG8870743.1 hypothetical protein PS861_03676 [Pseudomonas fluorescens]VVQ24692.1 hypothetical protein PS934_05758 [Pseudomonas fluorescens]